MMLPEGKTGVMPATDGSANIDSNGESNADGHPGHASKRDRLLRGVAARAFADDPEFTRYGAGVDALIASPPRTVPAGERAPLDFLFAYENEPHDPDDVFSRLRWGGQFVYASKHGRRVEQMNELFGHRGFETMPRPGMIREPLPLFGVRLPLLSKKLHFFVARKVNLVLPRQFSDRFTYHLQLVPARDGDVVEIKNMAVLDAHQGTGVGRALVEHALAQARTDGCTRVLVATGSADVGNLRFYQRLGFRMLSVERDVFTPAEGYPDGLEVDGIPLRDRVWFDQHL
jgi:ribosomal protein S18 acetylase RimI-like enzyme